MARARGLKPSLFKNEVLGVADPLYTLLFEGLWCLADREGRLEDRPLRIKGEIFPYREGLDITGMLDWLQAEGFIQRYGDVIQIVDAPSWFTEKSRASVSADAAARRARKRRASPAWANAKDIRAIYERADQLTKLTGVLHHVDHEIPLSSDLVCGLHVENNLRAIPADANLRKSNKFEGCNG